MKWRLGGLAHNALGVMACHMARVASQFLWVILLARALGSGGYGEFSGLAGLALVIGGFAGFGFGLLMYQEVARDATQFQTRWSQASRGLMWSAVPLSVLFVLLSKWLFVKADWLLLAALALSEVVFAPIVAQVASAYAAHDKMLCAAAIPVFSSVAKVFAVLQLLLWFPGAGLTVYAWLHMAMSAFAAIGLAVFCRRDLNIRDVKAVMCWSDIRSGLGFSAIWAGSIATGSLDKSFVLRWGGADIAGNYSVAQRFASAAAIPVEALVFAAMPRLFRAGAGSNEHPRMILMLVLASLGYGAMAGLIAWWAADVVMHLLGHGFGAMVDAMRALAFYVPVYCLRVLAAHILLGMGEARWRVLAELMALCLLALLMAWRVPVAGVSGAAQALVAAELVFATMLWFGVVKLGRKNSAAPTVVL